MIVKELDIDTSNYIWDTWRNSGLHLIDHGFNAYLVDRHCLGHHWNHNNTLLSVQFQQEYDYILFLLSL